MSSQFFTRKTIQKGRKIKQCFYCCDTISKGLPSFSHVGVWEGDFFSIHSCPICDAYLRHNRDSYDEGVAPGDLLNDNYYLHFKKGWLDAKIQGL